MPHLPCADNLLCSALQATVNKARAAYQNAAVASKGLVEDADKLDIVVKACQTEYIKLKLLNNNAKAYVNAKRLRYQRQADSFRYWAEFVHFETIGAIQVNFFFVLAMIGFCYRGA